MTTEFLNPNAGGYGDKESGSGIHVEVPKGPDGIYAGFVYRFIVSSISVLLSLAICFAWGFFNGWHVTNSMLIVVGIIFTCVVLIGERVRVSMFNPDSRPRGTYLAVGAVGADLRIGSRTLDRGHIIFDDSAWVGAYPYMNEIRASFYYRRGKGILDILGSLAALAVALPFGLIIAALIKLERRGPLFERVFASGQWGRPIGLFRFQTGFRGADGFWQRGEGSGVFSTFLVRSGLNRMPELLNVLRGELSLVGPEPRSFDAPGDEMPLGIKPGMTGLARISGYKWDGSQRVAVIDRYYVLNLSSGRIWGSS